MKIQKLFFYFGLFLFNLSAFAQVKIGDNPTTISTSSLLELESSNKALIITRVATTGVIASPVNGMLVYDISSNSVKIYQNDAWIELGPSIKSFILTQVGNEADDPNFFPSEVTTAQLASLGVTDLVPAFITYYQSYIDANPGAFSAPATVAEIQAMITAVNANNPTTTSGGTALITAYLCDTQSNGTLTEGVSVSGVNQIITATVASVGTYNITATSNGVTFAGSGSLSEGTQYIVLTATGTPTAAGTHSFALSTTPGCSFDRVTATAGYTCRAKIDATTYKDFLCYNLGADTSLDPHVPVVGLNGAYIQWGSRGPNTTGDSRVDWQTAANDGPLGFAAAPTAGNDNDGVIVGWSSMERDEFTWRTAGGAKTAADPCPTGYRVPTQEEWAAVNSNNTISRTGTWANSSTNYGTAIHYGPDLTLPTAGAMMISFGIINRGSNGYYWSSTGKVTYNTFLGFYTYAAFNIFFDSNILFVSDTSQDVGFPIRCIAE